METTRSHHLTAEDLRNRLSVTVAEAATALDVHRDTIVKAVQNGSLPGAKVGRQWRISAAGLLALLDGAPVEAARP